MDARRDLQRCIVKFPPGYFIQRVHVAIEATIVLSVGPGLQACMWKSTLYQSMWKVDGVSSEKMASFITGMKKVNKYQTQKDMWTKVKFIANCERRLATRARFRV